MRASQLFEQPTTIRRRFHVTLTAEEYVTNLSTQSGIKELPTEAQTDLLGGVRRRIEALTAEGSPCTTWQC